MTAYLVRYPTGHGVLPHVDGVARGRLYELNCVLVKPRAGGEFRCERTIFDLFGRIVLFRPDLHEHHVTRIEGGHRLLLSFALLRA
ncbi:MAG: 2OG-Fe(II) oxygenase [Pseudomonadales bacterium]|nr:2OG-Fe(II) oxygenase [Pseudomonadales bacterium]